MNACYDWTYQVMFWGTIFFKPLWTDHISVYIAENTGNKIFSNLKLIAGKQINSEIQSKSC